ncbi:putative signal transducing protein [Pseudidiomarina salilacus]|uniref:putative signal transducing protein n=1 Tax=Pseudidiomarina salilacus TaxID=3384452 RepID=UPI0039855772
MQVVYQADNVVEAELLKGLLEAHGIACHTGGFFLQGAVGDLAASGFANVWVGDDDVEAARALLKRYEQGEFGLSEDEDAD